MNPFLGIALIAIGAASAASFYVPLQRIKTWAWETYYLAHGVMAWIILPLIVAVLVTDDLPQILRDSPPQSLALTFGFGVLWGVGALTFGLSMRYLGLSLGYAVALGVCAAAGTLLPPIIDGQILSFFTIGGKAVILAGVLLSLGGIGICAFAGIRKEHELTDEQKTESVSEFSLVKGSIVAVVSGLMAACFAFGLNSGKGIADAAVALGTPEIHQNTPVFVVVLAGGFLTNLAWCLFLNVRNKTLGDYISGTSAILVKNYTLAGLAGALWYAQFFFYGMGTTKMGEYDFSAWSIHIALIITFSNFWGIAHKEWTGVSRKTWSTLWTGILILVLSAFVIGLGNYLS